MNKKAIIASSFSGGHIFPALAVADLLQRKLQIQSIFITNSKNFKSKIENRGYPLICIGGKNRLYTLVFRLGFDLIKFFFIVKKYNPSIVIGFGGAVTIVPIFTAGLLGIPTLIHEQNARFGKANRFLKLLSRRVALGFPHRQKNCQHKIVFTGNPLREDLLNSLEKEKINTEFTILVMGGSQGSHKININFIKAVGLLKDKNFEVIHISGSLDFDGLSLEYKKLGISHKVFRFLENISSAYNVANLVICRAGAMTLSEIAVFGIPAILIPYPYSGRHQEDNASIFKESGAALVISEEELTPQKLSSEIRVLMDNPQKLKAMSENMLKLSHPEAADNLIREIQEVANV